MANQTRTLMLTFAGYALTVWVSLLVARRRSRQTGVGPYPKGRSRGSSRPILALARARVAAAMAPALSAPT